MKIILSVGILFLVFANIFADQTITCKVESIQDQSGCHFNDVMVGQNEAIAIATDPADVDVNTITLLVFTSSSIYSLPSEVFTKFPNLKSFWGDDQKIQEIKADAFVDGQNLQRISLRENALTFLHADTFKGKNI
jgi:hypothetical protein